MTLALGILLLAFGALLVWGVDSEVAGTNVDVLGAALLAGGAIGVLLALVGHARGRTPERRMMRYDYLDR